MEPDATKHAATAETADATEYVAAARWTDATEYAAAARWTNAAEYADAAGQTNAAEYADAAGQTDATKSVSYTHLDVYKRQGGKRNQCADHRLPRGTGASFPGSIGRYGGSL